MTSTLSSEHTVSPEHTIVPQHVSASEHVLVPEHVVPEHTASEQLVPKPTLSSTLPETISESDNITTSVATDMEINQSFSYVVIEFVPNQPSTSTIQSQNSMNSQPSSSSRRAIVPVAPTKPDIPSPPTIFLDSTLLQHVCENISQELLKLIQARENLTHKDNYEKQWTRLKERVDFVLSKLQRTCLEEQDSAQQQFQDWLRGVDHNLQKVKILKTWVQNPPSIKGREIYDFIPSGVNPRDLDLSFLNKINLKSSSTDLSLL
jgi:hypothetical protein